MREDAAAGTTIVQVTATDPDSEDKFRSFSYSLLSGGDADAFRIDPVSVSLRLDQQTRRVRPGELAFT